MKKLALVVPSLTKGGGVPAVARFVKDAALRSGRYELKIISLCMASNDASSRLCLRPETWIRGPQVKKGEWEGLPFSHAGGNWVEFEFQRYRPRRVVADLVRDCDVVQVVCGSPAWANAVVGMGKPVSLQVATRAVVERRMRDSNVSGFGSLWRKAMTTVTDKLDDRALSVVDAIQLENPWMLAYAREMNKGRSVDVRYAPPGIDTTLFKPLATRDLVAKPYILCVGRLNDPRKNIGLLLEAYAQMPRDITDRVPLYLAGSSAPGASFWKRAEELGVARNICFIERPSRDSLIRLYQEASVFVLPSDEEGLGVVVLEAMSCGLPVISTLSGGPDGIIENGNDGYLVRRGDSNAISARLIELLSDSEKNIEVGLRARATVEKRYDEVIAGNEFIEVWDKLTQ